MREFRKESGWEDGNLVLALAPALTPKGVEREPLFFRGEAVHPLVISRGWLVLADIVATRYFQYQPVPFRDPILSAQGDRLRAECFSACNGVYARMDLLQEGLEGDISYGTTNVDIGSEFRKSLMEVRSEDRLHLTIGEDGLRALHTAKEGEGFSSVTRLLHERPVEMPDRWVRALGNCVPIHRSMKKVFELKGIPAKNFIAELPPVTGKEQSGWLTYSKTGVKLLPVPGKDRVYIAGRHRLSALKRVMSDVRAIDFYASEEGEKRAMMVEVRLPKAKLVLSLTPKSYQGYSGEGALLEGLATSEMLDRSDLVASELQFESKLDPLRLSEELRLSPSEVESALSLLAVSGKLGYDVEEDAYFHRELPEDPNRVWKDNPRLVGAKKLLENVTSMGDSRWKVRSGAADYRVTYDPQTGLEEATCTCAWYLKHRNHRGPCKHILAVKWKSEGATVRGGRG